MQYRMQMTLVCILVVLLAFPFPLQAAAAVAFGAVVLAVLVPLFVGASIVFFIRRDVQPIKGRLPPLVLLQNLVLVCDFCQCGEQHYT